MLRKQEARRMAGLLDQFTAADAQFALQIRKEKPRRRAGVSACNMLSSYLNRPISPVSL